MIKIRIDEEQSVDDHAVFLIKEYDKKSRLPRVAGVHAALEPQVCDDCRKTYWCPVDTYMCHHPCDGDPNKQGTGF